jgi:hypothetical protein
MTRINAGQRIPGVYYRRVRGQEVRDADSAATEWR